MEIADRATKTGFYVVVHEGPTFASWISRCDVPRWETSYELRAAHTAPRLHKETTSTTIREPFYRVESIRLRV